MSTIPETENPLGGVIDEPARGRGSRNLYALITPARNEEQFIERTICSVLNQRTPPTAWVIVDDASTDRTAHIVGTYVSRYPFIRLITISAVGPHRGFERKVAAFNIGLSLLRPVSFAFVGNLDADVVLPVDYYENILREFETDPRLGVAGGIVYTTCGERFITYDTSPDSVGGAVQLFRAACFRDIGGYIPLPVGGIDAAAEITARMKGWTVKKFPANKVYEQRPTGSAHGSVVAKYVEGVRSYSLGYSLPFYVARCAYKIAKPPRIIGSVAALAGFLSAGLRNLPILLAPEVVSYLRSEQATKLRALITMKGWMK